MPKQLTPVTLNSALLRMVVIPAIILLFILASISVLSARLIYSNVQSTQAVLIHAAARQGSQYLDGTAALMTDLGALVLTLPSDTYPILLTETSQNYQRFTALYLLDENGKVLLEYKPQDLRPFIGFDLSGESYFKPARDSKKTYFSDTFFSVTTNDLAVTVAQPLYKGTIFVGMLVAEINLYDLQENIQHFGSSQNDTIFIVDNRATLIVHPDHELVREQVNLGNLPVVRQGLAQPTYRIYFDQISKAWVMGSAAPMQNHWAVVTTRPVVEVFRPFFTMLGFSLIALLLSTSVFGMGVWFSLRRISTPISLLAEKAEQISLGQPASLSDVETQGSYRELNALVSSFDRMLLTIQARTTELSDANQKLEQELEERHRVEAALRESEVRYRRLFEDSPVALLEEDFSEVYLHLEALKAEYHGSWEQALANNPGLMRDCVSKIALLSANHTTLHLHKAKSLREMLKNRAQLLAKHKSFLVKLQTIWQKKTRIEFEDTLETLDGETRHVLIKWSVLPNQARPYGHVLVSLIDITARKLAEMEIQQHREHLEEMIAERTAELRHANQELESFAYTVSHDLRAPLRHIDGFSRILAADFAGQLGDEGCSHLEKIRSGAGNMARMIDGLLQLSRAARGELNVASVNLGELAQEIARELQGTEPTRKVEWKITLECNSICDARLLRAALQNLLGNAWKFSAGCEQAQIEFGCLSEQQAAEQGFQPEQTFFVRDNGAGFEMRYADKLFTPFQRLHNEAEFPGTGIGLATVARIIKKHGGRIWAQANPGKGATFYFTV